VGSYSIHRAGVAAGERRPVAWPGRLFHAIAVAAVLGVAGARLTDGLNQRGAEAGRPVRAEVPTGRVQAIWKVEADELVVGRVC
jgi:hypothetical protein